jgi:dihydrofolate reductase
MKTFIVAAVTADGFVARGPKDFSMDWTSPEDVKLFVRLTKEAGVVVFGSTTARTVIDAGRRLSGRRKIVYTRKPASITAEGFEPTSESPAQLLKRLEQEGAKGVAVCGGAQIYTMFLEAGLVDELYLTIEPKLFGKGVSLLTNVLERDLELLEVSQLNEAAILLHYRILPKTNRNPRLKPWCSREYN